MKGKQLILFILVLVLITAGSIATFFSDFLWFDSLGFKSIFLTKISWQIGLFLAGALFFFIFVSANIAIAKKKGMPFLYSIAAAFSIPFGLALSSKWLVVLEWINKIPFNINDPVFGKDVAFYIFSIPFLTSLWGFIFFSVFMSFITVLGISFSNMIKKSFEYQKIVIENLKPQIKIKDRHLIHLIILGSLLIVLVSIRQYISRFSILYSQQGIVVGAGYADIKAFLPMISISVGLSFILALLLYAWLFFFRKSLNFKKRHLLGIFLGIYLIFSFLAPTILPSAIQGLIVSPNELKLESPYIKQNIEFTKKAYNLNVEEKNFDILPLTNVDQKTINNVRILDPRPLKSTYKQTQEIRLYYDLSKIDIDRYNLGDEYTEVMISPRELNQDQITANAKTWVNLHMIYTHGYGAVVSPVNKVTNQGLPDYLVKDIPPKSDKDALQIDEPRIYYGEKSNNYVLVNTDIKEFDYPRGKTNEYTKYSGEGGVVLDSFFKKLLFAIRFQDLKILLTNEINSDSKIMFNRKIKERVQKIMPFLALDKDPYIVINKGKLYWILDAYTFSNQYPYSQRVGNINYIRNSVKVVVDAYDGSVDFYISDPSDPMIQTYSHIFSVFKSFEDFPFKEHIRYPEDLFRIQSEIFSTYHMSDTTVFYNKEDAWDTPREVYGTGQAVDVEPYYIIMRLPEEKDTEFILMTSFTPISKDNMVAWLTARMDGDNYGKLLLYRFPKDTLVYGPMQIEAKFDQDSEISQQLTLWSQQGSSVTRGNLLVIPMNQSLLYIEPLYIQAEQGQLPELKRVLVSDGKKVSMEITLAQAINVLFDGKDLDAILEGDVESVLNGNALDYYNGMVDALKDGDWTSFGEQFKLLGDALKSDSSDSKDIVDEKEE